MPLEVKDIREGTQLGHYVIMHHIADGGMGSVYKAFEPTLERYVAIKVLRAEFALDEEYLQHFQEEARAVAALRHANIVPIYYIGRENNVAYFSMAYIDGKTLDDWIEAGVKFQAGQALWFLSQAVAALECASLSGIVHLDIKPSNFLIDASNVLMLTDFGLAERIGKKLQAEEEREVFGTPAYVAPEQINKSDTDQRTDIYSLGATLFHLMAGQPPYDGDTVEEIVMGHLHKDFPIELAQKCGIPEGWVGLMQKMMEREPENRFQNYEELRAALEQVDSYHYETAQVVESEDGTAFQVTQPRNGNNPGQLHGLLSNSSGDWATNSVTENIKYTRAKALEGIQSPLKPLALNSITKTIRELAKRGEGDPDDLTQAMEQIPFFGYNVLALSHFIQEGGDEAVDPVDALYTITLPRARDLALSSFMLKFEWQSSRNFDWSPLWQHSLSVALIVDFIYEALNLKRTGLEFCAAMMHDVGKVLLGEIYPYVYFSALNRSVKAQEPLTDCEKALFGLDHAEAATAWMQTQAIPKQLIEVISQHEKPWETKRAHLLSHAIYSANHLAKQLGLGYSGNAVLDAAPWHELESTQVLWENCRRKDFEWEDFSNEFYNHMISFPDLRVRDE